MTSRQTRNGQGGEISKHDRAKGKSDESDELRECQSPVARLEVDKRWETSPIVHEKVRNKDMYDNIMENKVEQVKRSYKIKYGLRA